MNISWCAKRVPVIVNTRLPSPCRALSGATVPQRHTDGCRCTMDAVATFDVTSCICEHGTKIHRLKKASEVNAQKWSAQQLFSGWISFQYFFTSSLHVLSSCNNKTPARLFTVAPCWKGKRLFCSLPVAKGLRSLQLFSQNFSADQPWMITA